LLAAAVAHEGAVNDLMAVELGHGLSVLSAGDDGALALWEIEAASSPRTLYKGDGSALHAVAAGNIGGRWLAAFGGGDLTVRLMDLRTGVLEPWSGMLDNVSVSALAVGEVDGRPMVIAGGGRGQIRGWWLAASPVAALTYDSPGGIMNGTMALGIVVVGGVAQVASVDRTGDISLWDNAGRATARFHTGHAIRVTETGGEGRLVTARFANIKGRTLVAAADYAGVIRVLDVATQAQAAEPIVGLMGQVTALALPGGADLALVLGDDDGRLKMWSVSVGI
jgi:WD40 repeat protein